MLIATYNVRGVILLVYTEEDYKSYVEKLRKIEQIDWINFQLSLNKRPNFWSIIEYGEMIKANNRSSHEERLSKMIRWLLDPNETHELGNTFASRILDLVNQSYPYRLAKNKQVKVDTEYEQIDILYRDYAEKLVLAIELKQYSSEGVRKSGKSQLVYYDKTLKRFEDDGFQRVSIYLTPLAEKATNSKWIAVGYEQFIQIIDQVIDNEIAHSSSQYKEDTEKIIVDFKDELNRVIHTVKRDPREVRNLLTPKERELTRKLVQEITGEKESNYMEELMEQIDESFDVEQVILTTNAFIHSQDHTPNEESKILIRKIYNYLTAGEALHLNVDKDIKVDDRTSIIDSAIIESNNLQVETLQLTSRGQGIHILAGHEKFRIYLSSSGKGEFPGDHIHLFYEDNGEMERVNSSSVPDKHFQLKENLIMDDKIADKNGKIIEFEQLMEQFVIPAIVELNDKGHQETSN